MFPARSPNRLANHIQCLGDAAIKVGLEPVDTHFELVPARLLHTLTAYGGMITRFQHWSFGKAYFRLKMAHDFRLARMYELVINANPAIAYLLDTNTMVENLVVIAHVLAHVDFFQHHYRFGETPPNMPQRMAWNRDRMQCLSREIGMERLERLIEDAMVLSDLINPYRDDWHDPANVMAFLAHESDVLSTADREVLDLLYREARYFRPQIETKIANEGWATYWHVRLLRAYDLSPADAWEFARVHSLVAATGTALNPYALGLELWRQAETQGPEELWRGRAYLSDVALVDRYLTPGVAERAMPAKSGGQDFAPLKARLLRELDNGGLPRIEVESVDHGELVLIHRHEGRDLDFRQLPGAMAALGRLWGRRCHLLTSRSQTLRRLTWTGKELAEDVLSS